MTETIHTIPVGDLIDHETENFDACWCGPDVEFLEGGGRIVVHHSLDGREHDEPDHDRDACPLCSASTRRPGA